MLILLVYCLQITNVISKYSLKNYYRIIQIVLCYFMVAKIKYLVKQMLLKHTYKKIEDIYLFIMHESWNDQIKYI